MKSQFHYRFVRLIKEASQTIATSEFVIQSGSVIADTHIQDANDAIDDHDKIIVLLFAVFTLSVLLTTRKSNMQLFFILKSLSSHMSNIYQDNRQMLYNHDVHIVVIVNSYTNHLKAGTSGFMHFAFFYAVNKRNVFIIF